jgi:signal transduction histidine kinase/CHASE3 domain sensor protein
VPRAESCQNAGHLAVVATARCFSATYSTSMMQVFTPSAKRASARSGLAMAPHTLAGFLVAVLAVIVIAILSYASLQSTAKGAQSLTKTIEVMTQLQALVATLTDAETGQRGYLLTGSDSYLQPYVAAQDAVAGEFNAMRALLDASSEQRKRLDTLQSLTRDKMAELGETVALRRNGQADAALALVLTNRGKNLMDRIREVAGDMERSERQLLAARTVESQRAATSGFAVTWGGSAILLILIAVAATIAARDFRARQLQSWLRAAQIGLSELMQGDQPLDRLGHNVLGFLAAYLDAQVGAMFVAESGHFRRVAGYAIPTGFELDVIRPGDGLAGQAAKDNRPLRVRNVPANYLPIGSGVGAASPGELLIAPASIDGMVYAVLELGFFAEIDSTQQDLLVRVSESIAVAVRASKDRNRLEDLLQETQQQAEELQTREEELRVNNEELEEQGRTLKESRAQLESQQAELEQINSQLEEQTQFLEHQKDELAKSRDVLVAKTNELQRANEYKSEFLANMSHELRTPLNSTLILAKLLADNKDGNLTDTQVKFAQTIFSAGNDLLVLINDVLDLSRIEAGKVEVAAEPVLIPTTLEALAKTFQPAAQQKKLGFSTIVEPGTPDQIETDPQRLGQILKNLLSNALKFTEKGEVGLRVFAGVPGSVSFAVRDTGVGIPLHQQEVIFEAFRQPTAAFTASTAGPAWVCRYPAILRAFWVAQSPSTAEWVKAAYSRARSRSGTPARTPPIRPDWRRWLHRPLPPAHPRYRAAIAPARQLSARRALPTIGNRSKRRGESS